MSALPIDPHANHSTRRRAPSRAQNAERRAKVNSLYHLSRAQNAATDVSVQIRNVFAGERSDCAVAEKTGYGSRAVTAVKNGENEVSFQKLFAIMAAYPEIARRVEYWAGRFQQPTFWDPETQRQFRPELDDWMKRAR